MLAFTFPPRVSGEGGPRTSAVGGAHLQTSHAPSTMLSHGPPPPLRFTARGRISEFVLATHLPRPSLAHRQLSHERFALRTKGKRSAERRIVLPMSAPQTSLRRLRNSSVRGVRAVYLRAHLSALTLAALADRLLPRWLSPEPGFPRRRLTGVLPASPKNAAVKHAPCGPVFMPVDRGPRAARERTANPRAGTALAPRAQVCLENTTL